MAKLILAGSRGLIGSAVLPILSDTYNYDVVEADLALGTDLGSNVHRQELFEGHSDAEYLVNLFGYNDHVEVPGQGMRLLRNNGSDLEKYFRVNVGMVLDTCHDFIRYCNNAKSIVNVGSLYSNLSPRPDMYGGKAKEIGYTASKACPPRSDSPACLPFGTQCSCKYSKPWWCPCITEH